MYLAARKNPLALLPLIDKEAIAAKAGEEKVVLQ